MPKDNKPLQVVVEFCPSPDSEQRLQAVYDMIFRKLPMSLSTEDADTEQKD